MNPIKSKFLFDKTAKELDLPVKLVDYIVSFYYKNLQRTMSSVKYHSLTVPYLGTFVIKRKSLDEKLKRNTLFVQKIETDTDITVQTYELIMQKRKDIEDYVKVTNVMNEEIKRKEEIKLKRKEYVKSNTNLER